MPNGPTHDFITVVSAAALVPLALNADLPDNNPTNVIVLLGAYLASGLLFSPDLDLKSKPYKRWRLLRFIWLPYQNMVPHRSWISHSFFFGPLLRVLYFTGVMALLSFILLAVINAWGPCPDPKDPESDPCYADLDASGSVEINDLLMVLQYWGN